MIPSRNGVRRRVAPRVVVEAEEITANGVGAAVHVCGHFVAVGFDVSGRVADRDLAEAASVHVGLDVTSDGLDVWSTIGSGIVVDDLVGREEEQSVVVLGEHLDRGEDALQVDLVVGDLRISAVDRVLGGVDVEGEVDAGVGKSVHALVMVGRVVNRVDADGVDAELLELGNVTLAARGIGNRVLSIGCAAWLVVDTADVETLIASKESCTGVSVRTLAVVKITTYHFP